MQTWLTRGSHHAGSQPTWKFVRDTALVLIGFVAIFRLGFYELTHTLRSGFVHTLPHEYNHLARALYYFLFELVIPYGILLAGVAWIVRRVEGRSPFELERQVAKPFKAYWRGVYMAIRYVFSIWIILVLTGWITSIATHKVYVHIPAMLVMLVGWTVASAAVVYTVFGWILPKAIDRFGFMRGSALALVAFAILTFDGQFSVLTVVNLLLLGAVLLIFGLHRNELFSLVGILAGWQFALVNVFGFHYGGVTYRTGKLVFATANEHIWSGGNIGAFGGLLCTLVLLAVGGWYTWKWRNNK
jgi:hypothetical protein